MSVFHNIPSDFWEAHTALIGARGRELSGRSIGYATSLKRLEFSFGLMHHSTVICRFFADESILIDTGGWHTSTTKQRVNCALSGSPWRVYADRRVWYWYRVGQQFCEFRDGDRVFLEPGNPGQDGIFEALTYEEQRAAARAAHPERFPDPNEPSEDYHYCDVPECGAKLEGLDFVSGVCPEHYGQEVA